MNISQVDLNLLAYLDVLLRECNVTRAAENLGLSQPATSNALKRLRNLFNDPLLIRTSQGMQPTERAMQLQPIIRHILSDVEAVLQPREGFESNLSQRVFRIMASDYAEATLIPYLIPLLRKQAPGITLDFLTPSDVNVQDLEQGRIDMAINRFSELPDSFHKATVWQDSFTCVMRPDHPILHDYTLENYLEAQHIWVSKTGMGVGTGVDLRKPRELGWVDQALLEQIGARRNIALLTRHYQTAAILARSSDLLATLPSRIAQQYSQTGRLAMLPPPFDIPKFELTMAWSSMLHHNLGHRWLRRLIIDTAREHLDQPTKPAPST
ncbi:LysR family transcriptional regulator [Pelagibaculum spongiae]|uniref:LysR family transcriptional regulator n=1 Tax=Pelagibaculum spongiae TaxID=2080658 RepID=A0A2V1GRH5_9GAMM|nr:LysR family transcriptional regulator [Pelagibaculum spongiae]PVZ62966.1 LysR family transcriptional regulator [Pelagibaculum spongiae]